MISCSNHNHNTMSQEQKSSIDQQQQQQQITTATDEDDDFDFFYDYAKAAQNRSEAWTEQNWQEEMEKHPFFITKNPSPGESGSAPLVEALTQLKYDPEFNSPLELLESYRVDGNENFKNKRYNWAIASYSEGIRIARQEMIKMVPAKTTTTTPTTPGDEQQSSSDDQDITAATRIEMIKRVATLYNNRSAANFFLGNYRTAQQDARYAYTLDRVHQQKAILRVAKCLNALHKYGELIQYCQMLIDNRDDSDDNQDDDDNDRQKKDRHHRHQNPIPTEATIKELTSILEQAKRDHQRAQRDARRAQRVNDSRECAQKSIETAVRNRGIRWRGSLFETTHSAAYGHFVHFDPDDNDDDNDPYRSLIWPVIIIHTKQKRPDFVEEFHETSTFDDAFQQFASQSNDVQIEWNNLRIWYNSYEGDDNVGGNEEKEEEDDDKRYSSMDITIREVDRKLTLFDALRLPGYVITNAIPCFFLSPTKPDACIKPVEVGGSKSKSLNDDNDDDTGGGDGGGIRINKSNKGWKSRRIGGGGAEKFDDETKSTTTAATTKPLSVTLGDCLACSGCITSAEAVLISEQSHEKVLQILEQKRNNPSLNMIVVLSLSLQSLASLAAQFELSIQTTAERLAYIFHSLGVDHITDIAIARHICLIECAREFGEHYRQNVRRNKQQQQKQQQNRTILSSTCPGFVCYAEKSQGTTLVPLLSRVKSPQQIMGLLVKQRFDALEVAASEETPTTSTSTPLPSQIYHITLMPCYDKKLEASRFDNRINVGDGDGDEHNSSLIPEVDCVLTPLEVMKIFDTIHIETLANIPERRLDHFCSKLFYTTNNHQGGNIRDDGDGGNPSRPMIQSHIGSGSGGYAENLFRHIAAEWYGEHGYLVNDDDHDDNSKQQTTLQWKTIRNADFMEVNLYENGSTDSSSSSSSSTPVLSFAILNGFRNVQNLVSRLKRNTATYDYVEVSACPKGCLNGGAQLRLEPTSTSSTTATASTTTAYELTQKLYDDLPKTKFNLKSQDSDTDIEDTIGDTIDANTAQQLYQKNCSLYNALRIDAEMCTKMRTNFHVVEKSFNILNSNW